MVVMIISKDDSAHDNCNEKYLVNRNLGALKLLHSSVLFTFGHLEDKTLLLGGTWARIGGVVWRVLEGWGTLRRGDEGRNENRDDSSEEKLHPFCIFHIM